MQNKRGFVSAAVLIAIVLGLIVVGGGAYFVMQQQTPSQTASGNFDNLQQLPTNTTAPNPAPTKTAAQPAQPTTNVQPKNSQTSAQTSGSVSVPTIPPSSGGTVLAKDTLCNGMVYIRLQKVPQGEAGTKYPVDVYYIDGGKARSVVSFDESLLYYQYSMLHLKNRTYWPIDKEVSVVVAEKSAEEVDGVPLINIFVDPTNFSSQEFNKIGQCMKTDAAKFTALLKQAPNPYPGARAVALSEMRLGGLTYSSFVDYIK